ncbi:phosphatase PAP2 family protein [Raineyella fluvialis]|uniref:Phosphatase PAP2 family protein n=1 Tax=Raineyella fluvialis TaxID=2662261 RepID=A0A5Q2FDM8_9ACTN|nr:phosphatase PAP2 family protein [Raineyella fluvialis]QGF22825.1 phosphatase PAP2 family protein [Raineyella fluvialis]
MTVPDHLPSTPRRALQEENENGIFRRSDYPLTLILVAVVAILLITGLGFLLKSHPVDLPLAKAMNSLHSGAFGSLTSAIYHIISPVPAIIITAVICALIWLVGKSLRTAIAFGGLVAVTWLPSAVVKLLVHRPRPDAALMPHAFSPVQTDASFPSGHTVFIVAFVIAVAYLLRGTRWQRPWKVIGTVLVIVVALAIMIDAMHFPTDVLASVAWSLAVAPAVRVVGVDLLMPRIPFLAPASERREIAR